MWFTTFVVGLGAFLRNYFHPFSYGMGILGLTADLLAYSIITPAMPFQLDKLGYSGVSALVGWLSFAYVRDFSLNFWNDNLMEHSRLDSLFVRSSVFFSLVLSH